MTNALLRWTGRLLSTAVLLSAPVFAVGVLVAGNANGAGDGELARDLGPIGNALCIVEPPAAPAAPPVLSGGDSAVELIAVNWTFTDRGHTSPYH